MLHRSARFPPDLTLGIQAEESNLGFIRPENLVSHGVIVFQVPFGKLQAGCQLPFTEEWLSSDWWNAAELVVLLEGSPISTEELLSSVRVTIGFLVTYLTKALLPRFVRMHLRMHLSSISSLIANGLNTYVNKYIFVLNF